jgi:uncharacterized protein
LDSLPDCTLASVHIHPIKSCGGLTVDEALLIETGLEFDRAWMVVDEAGAMLTQREWPRMALIQPRLRHADLLLKAPGMLSLHLALDAVEEATTARVWNDTVKAYDMGALAAQWFTDFLAPGAGRRLRLVRFDPEQQRLAAREWTGEIAAETAFADGFPLLVANTASLADLNQRLAARGAAPVTMQRFRPNLVLDGLAAWDEDHIEDIILDGGEGPVVLRLVKPCTRCSIPNVDPVSAQTSNEPGDTLTTFRSDARMKGGITFGMNAVVVEGIERLLRPGQRGKASFKFD